MFIKKVFSIILACEFFAIQVVRAQGINEVAPRAEKGAAQRFTLGGEWNSNQTGGGLADFYAGYYPGAIMIPINLWGATRTTGLFRVPKNTTLTTLLSYARGPTEDAQFDEIKIKRVAGSVEKTFTVDLENILNKPGIYDVVLQPNDIIYVTPKKTFIDPKWVYLVAFLASVASIAAASVTISDKL